MQYFLCVEQFGQQKKMIELNFKGLQMNFEDWKLLFTKEISLLSQRAEVKILHSF